MSAPYSPAEVYGPEGTLIGHLQGVDVNQPGRTLVLALDYMLRIALDKRLRNRRIDKARVARNRLREAEFMAENGIPPQAEPIEEHEGSHIRYRWVVLEAEDLEVCELLFDDDRFEPAGRACAASAAESAWWAKHRTMHAGGLVSSLPGGLVKELKGLTDPHPAITSSIKKAAHAGYDMAGIRAMGEALSRTGPDMTALSKAVAKAGASMREAMDQSKIHETFARFGEALERNRERTMLDMMRIGNPTKGRVR